MSSRRTSSKLGVATAGTSRAGTAGSRSRAWAAMPRGFVDPARRARRDAARTRDWWRFRHASNVTGAIQPVAEIGALRARPTSLVLCDAAQSLGHMPLDVRELDVDLLAAPGHKGLLGPLGTGVLAIRTARVGAVATPFAREAPARRATDRAARRAARQVRIRQSQCAGDSGLGGGHRLSRTARIGCYRA